MSKVRLRLALAVTLFATAACTETAPPPSADSGAVEAEREAENKETVLAFYEKAINEKNFEEAAQFLGDEYIQHNPSAADGAEGLRGFINFLRTEFPEQHNEIKHVYADGDFVILHVHSVREPGTRGRAIVDIFRLDNGKVVQHWDVIQDIPDPSEARNSNGMF